MQRVHVASTAGGCASGSQAGKGAGQGATLGAVGGAVAGAVGSLIFGGNVAEGAAKGAVIGAASGAATGAVAGSMADSAAKETAAAPAKPDPKLAELRQRIGDRNYASAPLLAQCKHRERSRRPRKPWPPLRTASRESAEKLRAGTLEAMMKVQAGRPQGTRPAANL